MKNVETLKVKLYCECKGQCSTTTPSDASQAGISPSKMFDFSLQDDQDWVQVFGMLQEKDQGGEKLFQCSSCSDCTHVIYIDGSDLESQMVDTKKVLNYDRFKKMESMVKIGRELIVKYSVDLVILGVERSFELADRLSARNCPCEPKSDVCRKVEKFEPVPVLGWMNRFDEREKKKFSKKFSEEMIKKFMMLSGPVADHAYQTTVDFFVRMMEGGVHSHEFGMGASKKGEPCLFPKYPARPNIQWEAAMYKENLDTARLNAAIQIDCLLQKEFCQYAVTYYIGSYFGWLYLVKTNMNHNTLVTGSELDNEIEYSFSGDKVEIKDLVFEDLSLAKVQQGDVKPGAFQLYKVEFLGMGEAMLTRTRTCVVSRDTFFEADEKNFPSLAEAFKKIRGHIETFKQNDKKEDGTNRLTWMYNAFAGCYKGISKLREGQKQMNANEQPIEQTKEQVAKKLESQAATSPVLKQEEEALIENTSPTNEKWVDVVARSSSSMHQLGLIYVVSAIATFFGMKYLNNLK